MTDTSYDLGESPIRITTQGLSVDLSVLSPLIKNLNHPVQLHTPSYHTLHNKSANLSSEKLAFGDF